MTTEPARTLRNDGWDGPDAFDYLNGDPRWTGAGEPQVDTPAPRWVEDDDGDLAFLRSENVRMIVTRGDLEWVDQAGWDALVDLVRRNGTDPTPDAATVNKHMPPGAPLNIFHDERVLAAIQAHRGAR